MKNQTSKITLKHILWYFIIFSILGLIIETVFCYITTGVLESRKGLIWGPFCPVYGVGGIILILILDRYKDNSIKLFIIGSILGNVIEYVLSYILESMYGMRFWEYSYLKFNLNGRICVTYSIYWGILSVILIKFVKGKTDKIIDKITDSKIVSASIITFLIIDAIATVWAVMSYQERVVNKHNSIQDQKNIIMKIEEKIFSNEKMKKTFPNLRYIDENGIEHSIKELI